MSDISPGYGYRLLNHGEPIAVGDEFYNGQTWESHGPPRSSVLGEKYTGTPRWCLHRRRVEVAKGYRLLTLDETPVRGDEFYAAGIWLPVHRDYETTVKQNSTEWPYTCAFRRKTESGSSFIVCACKDSPQFGKSIFRASVYPYAHTTEESANAEAQRLANIHGETFTVLRSVRSFVKQESEAEKAWNERMAIGVDFADTRSAFIGGYNSKQ